MPQFSSRQPGSGPARYTVSDVDQIHAYAVELENRQDTRARWRAHELDERIWRLERYILEEVKTFRVSDREWPSVTMNGPRTYYNAIRRATTSNRPRFQVTIPTFSGEYATDQSRWFESQIHEQFAYGAWEAVDELRVRQGRLPFLDDLNFFASVRGGAISRAWFDNNSRFPFLVDLWDPITVAYDLGEYGPTFVSHHYRTPIGTVFERFPEADRDEIRRRPGNFDDQNNVEVYDLWWLEYGEHVWNVVLSGGGAVIRKPTEFRHVDLLPINIVRTFGAEVDPHPDESNYGSQKVLDAWETIYTANRDIYPLINRIVSLYVMYLRQHAIGPWHARATGFREDQLKVALSPFQIIQSPRGDAAISPLAPAQMAQEVKEIFSHLQGAEQRGSVPYSIFGQLPFELSGFAVNQLQGAVAIVAGQITKMMGWTYRLATDQLVQLYRQRGSPRIVVSGMDTREQQFMREIQRSDLREKFYLKVDVTPELPADKLQTAQIARFWSELGVDPITIFDEVLGLRDPRGVAERSIAWRRLQMEIQQKAEAELAGQQQQGQGVDPRIASPEVLGQTNQHEQFQPNQRNVSYPELEAAGIEVP